MMSDEQTVDEIAARVLGDRQWPVVVTLAHPIEIGSQRIASLEFRRGRLGDLKGMKLENPPQLDHLMLMASRMCGQPLKVIESLDESDAAEVIEVALGFFARCLGGGKTR